MHQASPVRGCVAWTIRYRTGSRRLMLGDAMSILARRTRAPLGNSPARMRANRSRFSVDAALAPRRSRPGRGQRAARLADLVGRLVVDVRQAASDEVDRPGVQLLEVVGGVVEAVTPVEPEPADVRLDCVEVLLLLLERVGVVEAQVAAAAELGGDAEVQADRLGVADVQVAVRLGREARHRRADAARRDVRGDDLPDEVAPCRGRVGRRDGLVGGLAAHGGRG